ncbi:MAG: ATP-binding protein [Armatimonas sp.]
MKNRTGAPVSGEDFYGREREIERLLALIQRGDSVLLSAPRRVGKTSLIGRVASQLQSEGWRILSLNVQDVADEIAFFGKLRDCGTKAELKWPAVSTIRNMVSSVRKSFKGDKAGAAGVTLEVGGGETLAWQDEARAFLSASADGRKKQPQLLAIDELPIFLSNLAKQNDGPQRVAALLHWLREARATNSFCLILCGSIGLDSFVERHGFAGTINDLTIETLGAYEVETAHGCLKALAEGAGWTEGVIDPVLPAILERLGWPLPYYLQILFHQLTQLERRNAADFPQVLDVEAAYAALLGIHQRPLFHHWDSRLDDQFIDPEDIPRARVILKALCTKPNGITYRTLIESVAVQEQHTERSVLEKSVNRILDSLERDGYLLRNGNRYTFRSFLLRDYWKACHAR